LEPEILPKNCQGGTLFLEAWNRWVAINIHLDQEGYQILDGIIISHESIHSLKTSKKSGMILKLDLSKPVDQINWDFLREILGDFFFDPSWISWILNLISFAFFYIMVNVSPSPTFKYSRGLRKRDHLYPYLLIILIECLGTYLKQALLEGHLKGLSISPRLLSYITSNLWMTPLFWVNLQCRRPDLSKEL
jgi:hypothetical protein